MTDAIDIRARLAGAPPSTWVDLRDAAAYLGLRPSSLRSAIARGQIAPDGRGPRRSPVFHRSTLDAYLTARAHAELDVGDVYETQVMDEDQSEVLLPLDSDDARDALKARLAKLEAVARAARSLERCADHSCEVPWCVRCQRESASQEALAAAFRDLDGGS